MNHKKSPSYVLDELQWEVHHLVLDLADTRHEIRTPPKGSDAIYSVPLFLHAKIQGENPVKSAEEVAQKWNNIIQGKELFPNSVIHHFEASNGYVNVFADKKPLLSRILKDLLDYEDDYGNHPKIDKTMVVDYCSPNIAKPLTVGHLRSTIIGQALINILKAQGFCVEGINFMGDWGTQFGKLLVAFKRWGDEKKLENEPIPHLVELYVRFHKEAEADPALEDEARAAFKRLGEESEAEQKIWRRFRDRSLEAFKQTVSRLGVKFDHNWFESEFEGKARNLVNELLAQGIAEESEGAVIIKFKPLWPGRPPEPPPVEPPLLLRKSDGTTLYAARDLASALKRIEDFKPVAKLIYVVASEQTLYFTQLWNTLEIMRKKGYANIPQSILEHVRFGMVSLPSGKISTRAGRVVYLDDLLDEAKKRAEDIIKEKNPDMPEEQRKEVARKVGIGAVIYADLAQDRIKDITFDWSKMLSFDGNSAPYLQYAAVRCAKILAKAKPEDSEKLEDLSEEEIPRLVGELKEAESTELCLHLGRFPQAVTEASERYAPHVIAGYLYEVAVLLSRFYTQVPVLKAQTDNARLARLMLVRATGRVLRKGLALLGIETPEEM